MNLQLVFLNDLWKYDLDKSIWVRSFIPTFAPSPRKDHSAVIANGKMIIWGGLDNNGVLLNDMWAFDLTTEVWSQIYQGKVLPSPRSAHAGIVLADNRFWVFGGLIKQNNGPNSFWNPFSGSISIPNPNEYTSDVWNFNFQTMTWVYVDCTFEQPSGSCNSNRTPICGCSEDAGVCVSNGVCICKGDWTGENCTENVCANTTYRGYSLDVVNQVLISESLLKIGRSLTNLKQRLLYVQSRLPPFSEINTCTKFQPISQLVLASASVSGLQFYENTTQSLLPVFEEFSSILDSAPSTDYNL